MERSWAKVFADEIFPEIDEQRFSVLYSKNLMLDPRYQYDQNIHSDSQFMKEYISSQEAQEEKVTVITEGPIPVKRTRH